MTPILIKIGLIIFSIITGGYVVHAVATAAAMAMYGLVALATLAGIGGGSIILYRKLKKYKAEKIAGLAKDISSAGIPIYLHVIKEMALDYAKAVGKAFHEAYIEVIEKLKSSGMIIMEGRPKSQPAHLHTKAIELKKVKNIEEELKTTIKSPSKVPLRKQS